MKHHGVCVAAAIMALNAAATLPAGAELIATFTRNPANPILRGVRVGSAIAAKTLDVQIVHFIPRSEDPPEQLGLIEEVIRNKPDALVFAPFDPKAMVPAVDKLNAAGIPVTNVNERLAGGNIVAYVGTDDYQLALTTARFLLNAMGRKGNVVMLEGPDNLPTSIARVKAYRDALKEFPDVKLLASKSANYARTPAVDVMKSFLRLYPQIDGVLAANDPMAIGAIESLKAANKKALVVGINASREVIELVKSGDLLGSGDYNGFIQGCLAAQIAVRNLRKQATPKEISLKAIVMDKTNYQDYENSAGAAHLSDLGQRRRQLKFTATARRSSAGCEQPIRLIRNDNGSGNDDDKAKIMSDRGGARHGRVAGGGAAPAARPDRGGDRQ